MQKLVSCELELN